MMGILEHKGNEMQLFFAEVILGRRTSQSFYRQRKFRRRPASIAQARKAERPDLRHENWRLNGKDGSLSEGAVPARYHRSNTLSEASIRQPRQRGKFKFNNASDHIDA